METNKIYQGDCLEIMPQIESGSVDMILCDLPYGTTSFGWDSLIDLERLWIEYKRVIKSNGVIALTGQQPFVTDLINANRAWFRYELIWDKVAPRGYLDANKKPLRVHENILIFYKSEPYYSPQMWQSIPKHLVRKRAANYEGYAKHKQVDYESFGERYPLSIIRISDKERTKHFHPTPKPADLFEYLILTFTRPGELVLDNCSGGGTTGVACVKSKRNYILIEREPEYITIAEQRIASIPASLFD